LRVGVIGAGLGGLLAAAKLCRLGCDVEIFERLPFIGGRFTNIEYKGYQLTTGALHMIPHGAGGPLSTLLADVGADVEIIPSSPPATIRIRRGEGFEDVLFREFLSRLSFWNRLMYRVLLFEAWYGGVREYSFKDWISRRLKDERVLKLADAFCGWALSVTSEQVTAQEGMAIVKNICRYGGSGVPRGGCKAVIDALADVITESGGRIHTNKKVEGILVKRGVAQSLCVNGEDLAYDVIISDLGHVETQKLIQLSDSVDCSAIDAYRNRIASIVPIGGIKFNLGCDTSLIEHTGILLTPYARRISGLNQVTNADPSLAPKGKHLVMAHMPLRSSNLEEEARIGLEDLKNLFPGADYEVLMVQTYHDGWPVNRCASGADIGNLTPYKQLYVVGDGAKGMGGIEVDGVALGVENTVQEVMRLQGER
jgi:phytoene dehydrogenase-like protein